MMDAATAACQVTGRVFGWASSGAPREVPPDPPARRNAALAWGHGIHTTGLFRPEDQPHRSGLHELRRHARRASTSGRSTTTAPSRSSGRRVELGHHLLGHRQRLRPRHLGGDRRPRDHASTPRREDIVLATKVHFPMHDGPGGSGLSRKAIMEQIDASLTRLGTDYVDLYQIHRFDPTTPVEETMEALHDVVKAGKARYLGASSMWAWQFAKMQHAADAARLDPVRVDAGPVQPDAARGGARDVRPARRSGRRQHPVQPARQGPRRPPVGRAHRSGSTPTRWAARTSATATSRSSTRSQRSPRLAASRWRRSRSPGCCTTRSCRPRSSAPRSRTISPTPSLRSTWRWTAEEIAALEDAYTPRMPVGY